MCKEKLEKTKKVEEVEKEKEKDLKDEKEEKKRRERDALDDYTGRALLMPLESVYRYLIRNDFEHSGPINRASIMYGLCEKCGVSKENAMKRIKEVCILKGIGNESP